CARLDDDRLRGLFGRFGSLRKPRLRGRRGSGGDLRDLRAEIRYLVLSERQAAAENADGGVSKARTVSRFGTLARDPASPRYSSSPIFPRRLFTSPRRAFAFRRRRSLPAVGFVAMRRFGATSAARMISARRSRAISRLRAWLRVSSARITMAPSSVQRRPASRFSRALTAGDRCGLRSASNRSSTAVETLFTFCPPGPEAREKVSVISQSAMAMVSVIRSMARPGGEGVRRLGCSVGRRKSRSAIGDRAPARREIPGANCAPSPIGYHG